MAQQTSFDVPEVVPATQNVPQESKWSNFETVFTNAKAGMGGVDKEHVKRIVYEMSKVMIRMHSTYDDHLSSISPLLLKATTCNACRLCN